ncbi:uncharacterized protein [Typha angustifolia]|uniref:uncharacterized protein n=1 Tax=Typha angustifolia TaxID=59011 RepID=UPI003C302741
MGLNLGTKVFVFLEGKRKRREKRDAIGHWGNTTATTVTSSSKTHHLRGSATRKASTISALALALSGTIPTKNHLGPLFFLPQGAWTKGSAITLCERESTSMETTCRHFHPKPDMVNPNPAASGEINAKRSYTLGKQTYLLRMIIHPFPLSTGDNLHLKSYHQS